MNDYPILSIVMRIKHQNCRYKKAASTHHKDIRSREIAFVNVLLPSLRGDYSVIHLFSNSDGR